MLARHPQESAANRVFTAGTLKAMLRISQNYLTSSSLIKRIINLSSIGRNDVVVEIGAGKGHLTKGLCDVCGRVMALELDRSLYTKLSEKYSDIPNAQFLCYDFLKWNLPKCQYKVFANIPFRAILKKARDSAI